MEKIVHHLLYQKSERAMCGALNTPGLVWSPYAANVTCKACNATYEAFHAGLTEMVWRESLRRAPTYTTVSKNQGL